MERRYVSLAEGIERLGGDAEAFAQSFEHGQAPLILYTRLRDFPLAGLGAYIWTRAENFHAPTLSGTWTWPDFVNLPETRIYAEDDFGDRLQAFATGYFIVHPFCVRAALAGVEALASESIYLLPPRVLDLPAYRSDTNPSEWLLARWDLARRGSLDGFFLSTSEISALGERSAIPVTQTTTANDTEVHPEKGYVDAPNLEAAIAAYRAVKADPSLTAGRTVKQAISRWVEKNRPDISETARGSIAAVANWDTAGGAPPTPTRTKGKPTPG